jgi:hypothetical protein
MGSLDESESSQEQHEYSARYIPERFTSANFSQAGQCNYIGSYQHRGGIGPKSTLEIERFMHGRQDVPHRLTDGSHMLSSVLIFSSDHPSCTNITPLGMLGFVGTGGWLFKSGVPVNPHRFACILVKST